jgi:arsenite-transporting ATPase
VETRNKQARYVFFSGKGGVGKTTMACATAVHSASQGKRTLIVTTDPASNLADVFEVEIGHHIRPLGLPNLWGMEIDPDKATEEYRERILAPMRAVMPADVIKVMEEQFRSPCTTEIASFDRFVDFMTAESTDGSGAYDVVIFDTAPTGHTIRLLELPVDWSKHIEESAKGGGNTCIGPVAAIQENKKKYDEATRLLGDAARTDFIFVLQPEETSLYETKRSLTELATIGIKNVRLIVNGILPEEVCEHPFFKSRFDMQQRYLTRIWQEFPLPTRRMLQRDGEIKGIAGLLHVAGDLFSENGHAPSFRLSNGGIEAAGEVSVSLAANIFKPLDSASMMDLFRPVGGKSKAVFFTGKGGVGKTTMACAAAYATARRGLRTLLLTTDPASHIGQVLNQDVNDSTQSVGGVENLWAVMIDQEKAAQEYKARIIEEATTKYSPDMLAAVREELESPCTEEMAAFDKFMGYVEQETYDVVIFDTAPTGHTLRLLQLPFDYADQVGLMVATNASSAGAKSEVQKRFDHITDLMKDPERSVFVFVVYPESTPVVEAHRAMLDLRDAGIGTQLVVANQVLAREYCTNDYFVKRRAMQEKYLAEIKSRFGLPVAIMPLLETEIIGLDMVRRAADVLFELGREPSMR